MIGERGRPLVFAAAVILLAASAATGCSVAFGIDDAEYAHTPEAGSDDASTSGSADAAADSPPVEAASPDDASSDASVSLDSSVPSPCTGTAAHAFCDDFEGAATLEARGWAAPTVADGGTLAIDDADSRSPSQSLHIASIANGPTYLSKSFGALSVTSDLRFSFDLKTVALDHGGSIAFLAIGNYWLRLRVQPNGNVFLDEWDSAANTVLQSHDVKLTTGGAWNRVDLKLHFAADQAPGSRVTLSLDGASALDVYVTPNAGSGDVQIGVGVFDAENTSLGLRYDNVTFDRAASPP